MAIYDVLAKLGSTRITDARSGVGALIQHDVVDPTLPLRSQQRLALMPVLRCADDLQGRGIESTPLPYSPDDPLDLRNWIETVEVNRIEPGMATIEVIADGEQRNLAAWMLDTGNLGIAWSLDAGAQWFGPGIEKGAPEYVEFSLGRFGERDANNDSNGAPPTTALLDGSPADEDADDFDDFDYGVSDDSIDDYDDGTEDLDDDEDFDEDDEDFDDFDDVVDP